MNLGVAWNPAATGVRAKEAQESFMERQRNEKGTRQMGGSRVGGRVGRTGRTEA